MIKITDFGVNRKETTLPNGTTIVVFEKPNTPVSITTAFFSGSRFDPEGKEEIAHLLEHMLVAGTEKFPTKDKIATYIERLGGINSASVGSEIFRIDTDIGESEDIEDAFFILSQELKHSLFNPETFEKEKNAVINEIASSKARPGYALYKGAKTMTYRGMDIERIMDKEEKNIKNISREDLIEHKNKFICSNRMALIVAGGTTLEEVENLTQKYLMLKKGQEVQLQKAVKNREKFIEMVDFPSLNEQTKFVFTFRADIPFLSYDRFAIKLLTSTLGGGRASILTKKLRYEKGLVYYVGSGHSLYLNTGDIYIIGDTQKKDLTEVLNIIADTLADLKENGLDENLLQFSKDKIIKSSKREIQTSADWVDSHVYSTLAQKFQKDKPQEFKNKSYTIEDFYGAVNSIKSEEINNILKKYISRGNWYLTIVGNDLSESYKKFEFGI